VDGADGGVWGGLVVVVVERVAADVGVFGGVVRCSWVMVRFACGSRWMAVVVGMG